MNDLHIFHNNHRPIAAIVAKIVAISLEPRVQMIKNIIAIAEVKIAQPETRLRSGNSKFGKGTKYLAASSVPFQ